MVEFPFKFFSGVSYYSRLTLKRLVEDKMDGYHWYDREVVTVVLVVPVKTFLSLPVVLVSFISRFALVRYQIDRLYSDWIAKKNYNLKNIYYTFCSKLSYIG